MSSVVPITTRSGGTWPVQLDNSNEAQQARLQSVVRCALQAWQAQSQSQEAQGTTFKYLACYPVAIEASKKCLVITIRFYQVIYHRDISTISVQDHDARLLLPSDMTLKLPVPLRLGVSGSMVIAYKQCLAIMNQFMHSSMQPVTED